MENTSFMRVEEVAQELGVSKSYAYKIVQKLNKELKNKGFLIVEVCTYNTALKNRLTEYARKYPSECRLIADDGNGCLTFEVNKGRFGFKLTAPYSEERRKAASELQRKIPKG